MKNFKIYILLVGVLFTAFSCDKDDLDSQSIFDTDSPTRTEFDQWIYDSLTAPYNVTVDYLYNDKEIDVQLAEQIISRIVAIQPRQTTIPDIIATVAEYFNVPPKSIVAQNRSKDISQARHVALYLSKVLTNCSLNEIGFKMGRRTHATVLHSISLVKTQLEFDPVLRQRVAQLQAALTA